MNAVESAAVMERLREGIITYLHHIISLLLIGEQEFLPTPFPNDPTRPPADFPHGDCFHTFTVQWNDAEHQVQHNFESISALNLVSSTSHGNLYSSTGTLLKRGPRLALLVDSVLYEDRSLYQITGPLVLVSLGLSVVLTEPVHIRKITVASPNAPHTSLEFIQMDCNYWALELARREV